MPLYQSEVTVRNVQQTVFDFYCRPDCLVEVTLPSLNLRFFDAPEVVTQGSVIEFELTHFGQGIKATHEITELTAGPAPADFVIAEKQLKGPMKHWVQRRTIAFISETETRVAVEIEFEGPGGLVGLAMNESRIRSGLNEGYEYQFAALKEKLDQ